MAEAKAVLALCNRGEPSALQNQPIAASPLTLLALMTGLTRLILHQEPQPFELVTYLDDRNVIARNPQQTFRLWQAWQSVSARVGLYEKDAKARVVPRRSAYRVQLLEAGFTEHHLATATRVLGMVFTAKLGSVDRETQNGRLQAARVRLQRIDLLPVNMRLKAMHTTSLVIPKASWGSRP